MCQRGGWGKCAKGFVPSQLNRQRNQAHAGVVLRSHKVISHYREPKLLLKLPVIDNEMPFCREALQRQSQKWNSKARLGTTDLVQYPDRIVRRRTERAVDVQELLHSREVNVSNHLQDIPRLMNALELSPSRAREAALKDHYSRADLTV